MGCHIFDPVFTALELNAPQSVSAVAAPVNAETWSERATVTYIFPRNERIAGASLTLTWYDGSSNAPPLVNLGLPKEYQLPAAGSVFVGETGTLLLPHVDAPKLFTDEQQRDVVLTEKDRDHYTSWAHACLGDDTATSHFGYSGPLTEAVLLGTIAVRLPEEKLLWNTERFTFEGSLKANDLLRKSYRTGWEPAWI
jgi:hypothetical protein